MKRIRHSLWAMILILLTSLPLCLAGTNYDFKKITPEIDNALKNRQARYYELQRLKQAGVIGENNKGYVTDLKDNGTGAAIVAAENRDRRVIYEALAEQNALGGSGLLEVQRAFAEVQAEKAGAGDMVQTASGIWQKKS